MGIWNVGIESWIIQDGNQPDFRQGQLAEFALFFQLQGDLKKVKGGIPAANLVKESVYNVTARVVYTARESWGIYFGLLAYTNQPPPPGIKVGAAISAQIWLGVDYYLYDQALSKIEAVPPMIYTWRVQQIHMQTTPFIKTISTEPGRLFGKEIFVRDLEKLAYKELAATDARSDDDGSANYLLACEEIGLPAKRTRRVV